MRAGSTGSCVPTSVYDEKAWNKSIVKGRAAAQVLEAVEERLAGDDFTSAERLEAIVMGVGDELTESIGATGAVPTARSASPLPAVAPDCLCGSRCACSGRDTVLARLRAAQVPAIAPAVSKLMPIVGL